MISCCVSSGRSRFSVTGEVNRKELSSISLSFHGSQKDSTQSRTTTPSGTFKKDPLHLKLWVDLPLYTIHRSKQQLQAFGWKVSGLYGYDYPICRC